MRRSLPWDQNGAKPVQVGPGLPAPLLMGPGVREPQVRLLKGGELELVQVPSLLQRQLPGTLGPPPAADRFGRQCRGLAVRL